MLQKVLRSLEVASEVLEELSRLGEADKEAVRQKCQEFLQNLQEVQQILVPAIEKFSQPKPFEGNSYLARAQADAAEAQAEAALLQINGHRSSITEDAGAAANGDALAMEVEEL